MAQSGGYLSYIFDEAVAFETAASQASTGFSARPSIRLPSGTTVSARQVAVLPMPRIMIPLSSSPAQARVAARVADGLSPDEVAGELKLGTGTVRWHVKRIMARVEAGRQAELVHLVLSSPLGYLAI